MNNFVFSSLPFYSTQILVLVLLFANGLLGNSNHDLKSFARASTINNTEIIGLIDISSKEATLLRFYLPKNYLLDSSRITSLDPGYYIVDRAFYDSAKFLKQSSTTIIDKYKSYYFIKY